VRWIYGLAGSDMIASKSALAHVLRNALPQNVVNAIMPKTYITSITHDMDRLKQDFNPTKVYVMKKNIQQQKGFVLTQSLDELLEKHKDYVVIQEVLQDPFIVSDRKINMRVYLLIVVRAMSQVEFYYYNDGFMYYTVDSFKAYSTDAKNVITTGLAGREMYRDRPLTHQDLLRYIGPEKAHMLRNYMTELCKHVANAYHSTFIQENRLIKGTKFLVYGMDVAPDQDLRCKIMEVNKGPDLSYKDDRDRQLKMQMVTDAFSIVGLLEKKHENGFIRI
jgi:hypothetical protein